MPKMTKKNKPKIKLSVRHLIASTNKYIKENPLFVLCLVVINMVFMLVFKSIPNGISNPISLILIVAYYVFWCAFFRYYYHLKPYVQPRALFGSMGASAKALVVMSLVAMAILWLPLLPVFLGYDDAYLSQYERYISAVENMSNPGEIGTSLADMAIIYGILALLSPILICKPYMAWISSLRGTNASFRKAGDKLRGNYIPLAILSFLLLYPQALGSEIDNIFHLQNWFNYTLSIIVFVYSNIIFAKMYDWFYLRH